eukprot:11215729-Lingulodinium_polyedra.AAC.1
MEWAPGRPGAHSIEAARVLPGRAGGHICVNAARAFRFGARPVVAPSPHPLASGVPSPGGGGFALSGAPVRLRAVSSSP